MKKVKIEEKFEQRFNAFFDEEEVSNETALNFTNADSIIQENELFSNKYILIWKIFKQVFLFLPSAFLLFYITLGFTLAIVEFYARGFGILLGFQFFLQLLFIFALETLSFFGTWFGLSSFTKKSDIAIPISIISVAVLLGIIIGFTTDMLTLARQISNDFRYAICLFPIALIVPNLVKMWLDQPKENL
ncbi:MAG: hypothetical protein K1X72_07645 [Pyrinomonadaceae bacterium]|nr:hypothetical protein [Pyrinomonadaceae bacterium]